MLDRYLVSTLGVVFLFSANTFGGDDDFYGKNANAYNFDYSFGQKFEKPSQFDLDKLISKIDSKHAATVDDVLKLLPEDFQKQYVLIRSSESLQKSLSPVHSNDITEPRVLMYGGSGLVISFTDPSLPGGQRMEMLQATKDHHWVTAEFEEKKGVTRNPQSCVACHGTETRPLWDGYPCWPQAYAGNRDNSSPSEAAEINRFVDHMDQHPRYKILQNLKATFTEIDPISGGGKRLKSNPNNIFNNYLHHFDDGRTAELIKKIPHYAELKYVLAATLGECFNDYGSPKPADFFSPEVWKEIQPIYEKLEKRFTSTVDNEYDGSGFKCEFVPFKADDVLFKAVLLSQKVQVQSFFTSVDPLDPHYLTHGFDPRRRQKLANSIAQADPEFSKLAITDIHSSCAALREKSVAATASLFPKPVSDASSCKQGDSAFDPSLLSVRTAVVFSKCIGCHRDPSSNAPDIPFDNYESFKKWIAADPSRAKDILYRTSDKSIPGVDRMPYVGDLQNFERDAIAEYIHSISP